MTQVKVSENIRAGETVTIDFNDALIKWYLPLLPIGMAARDMQIGESVEFYLNKDTKDVLSIPRIDLSDSGYLEMRERVLMTELNWVRRKLGKEPKTCPKCGERL